MVFNSKKFSSIALIVRLLKDFISNSNNFIIIKLALINKHGKNVSGLWFKIKENLKILLVKMITCVKKCPF